MRYPLLACLVFSLATALLLTGCGSDSGEEKAVFAINPLTAEVRSFASESEVPDGWAVCAAENDCPEPVACVYLAEADCKARSDCSPIYADVAVPPQECDDADPPPDVCDGNAYTGCVEAAESCTPATCGPTPLMPAYICPDGSPGGFTGRCLLQDSGACGWEIRDCPEPCSDTLPECDLACPEGAHNPTDACGRVHTCECVPEDCSDVPQCEFECPADTHNPVDARGCTHTCECAPDSGDCTDEECGPAPMCPAYECDDGSLGGCTGRCYRLTDDSCGWEIRNCPSDALRWYWTCGDPVCGGPGGHRESGLPECTTEEAGEPCTSEGASCDPMDDCNAHLICARSDPRQEPGGCPISRREFKRDIHYLTPEDRARFSDEIMDMRLATYRYRDAPDRLRLGFIIEDQEPSVSIDAGRDMVDLYGYVSMAVATLQRQSEEIAALRLKLEELNARCAPGEAAVCQ